MALYDHPRTKTGKPGYRDSSQKIESSRRVGVTRRHCKPFYTPSLSSPGAGKGNIHMSKYSEGSSKAARPGKKERTTFAEERNISRERKFLQKWIYARNFLLEISGWDTSRVIQEPPEEIIKTPDSALYNRFKGPRKHH